MRKKAIKDRPQKQQAKEKIKLSRAEKKEIAALMRQAKGDGKKHTAQQTIPYETMYPDGICRVKDSLFSKSIEFSDINYQLASIASRFLFPPYLFGTHCPSFLP